MYDGTLHAYKLGLNGLQLLEFSGFSERHE
jgi:hypothetical protein